jgi:hypothetical protein
VKLYTVVVHYLQMCMKEYGCCPKFRRGDNSTYTPFKFWTATVFLHAHLQVVYYKCVKFHKNPISRLGGVAFTRYTTRLKFRRGGNSTYTFRKRGVVYLVSANPPNWLIGVL